MIDFDFVRVRCVSESEYLFAEALDGLELIKRKRQSSKHAENEGMESKLGRRFGTKSKDVYYTVCAMFVCCLSLMEVNSKTGVQTDVRGSMSDWSVRQLPSPVYRRFLN
jgi:hypothetical protein